MILKKKAGAGIGNNKGFSLIEILMAVSIFSIGILAVATMQIAAINGNKIARKTTKAVTWSCDRADRLLSLSFTNADLNVDTIPYTPPQGADGIDNNENGVIDEPGETGQISISWVVTAGAVANTINVQFNVVEGVSKNVMTLNFIKARNI